MDIDIDFRTDFDPTDIFPVVTASMKVGDMLKKHPCGAYLQNIPVDPITGRSAIPHKFAQLYGYQKIDFLHLSLLDHFNSKQEMKRLLKTEPKWGLLMRADVVEKLFQLKNSLSLLRDVKPTNIETLADCISIIRPGKQDLIDDYIKDPEGIRPELYEKTDNYSYKKGHAIAYAMLVVLQLHLIDMGKL